MLKIANDAYAQGVRAALDSLNLPDMVKEAALDLLLKEAARAERQFAELAQEVKKTYPNASDAYIKQMVEGKSAKEINQIKKTFSAAANPKNKAHSSASKKLQKLLGPEALSGLEGGTKTPAKPSPSSVKVTKSPMREIPLLSGGGKGPVVPPSKPLLGGPAKPVMLGGPAKPLMLEGPAAKSLGRLSGRAKLLGGLGLAGLTAAGAYGLSGEEDQGLSNAELAALGLGGTAALGGGLYAAGAFE